MSLTIFEKPSIENLNIETFGAIEDIQSLWDSFLPVNHNLKSQNLIFLEKSTSIKPIYTLLRNEHEVIGLIYFQQISLKKEDIDTSILSKTYWSCLVSSLLGLKINVLICGNLYRQNFPSYYFKNDEDKHLIFNILDNKLESISHENICGIFIKDCCIGFKTLKKDSSNFKQLEKDLTMQMEISNTWNSLEDYSKDLSKKYRKRFEKINNSSKDIIIKELNITNLTELQTEISDLHENVVKNQHVKIGRINSNYFIEMKKSLANKCNMFGFYFENKLIGFSSHIQNESNNLELHYIGMDYSYNEKLSLYFNILNHGLQEAIINKNCKLELGRTAFTAKASLGAITHKALHFFYIRGGVSKIIFDFLLKKYQGTNGSEILNRNPFKVETQANFNT